MADAITLASLSVTHVYYVNPAAPLSPLQSSHS